MLNSIHHKNNVHKYIKITKKDDNSILNFHHDILYSFQHVNLNPDYTSDQNISYSMLHDIIQNAKAKHMPHKTVKLKKHKHKKSLWITHSIIRSIQYRDNVYKNIK